MRIVLCLALLSALVTSGCKKKDDKAAQAPPPAPVNNQAAAGNQGPAMHAPTGVVVGGVGSGGSGGAAQAIRKAATRTVAINDLNNLRLFIDTASSASGQMPTVQEITAGLQREAPGIYQKIVDQSIILTGTRRREGIWAYTAEAQTPAGEHMVLTSSSVERMTAQVLNQRLRGG
jgi:hypothetical protein